MSNAQTVTLTMEQLGSVVERAVSAAMAALPKRGRPAKPKSPEETAKLTEREANREAYLARKKDTAVRLMREKGQHYNLFKKGRKILIFSDLTVDKARRNGTLRGMGDRIWSTVEGHSLKESATA
jgi:hypothetical protein